MALLAPGGPSCWVLGFKGYLDKLNLMTRVWNLGRGVNLEKETSREGSLSLSLRSQLKLDICTQHVTPTSLS